MPDNLKAWQKIWKQEARTSKGNEKTARKILRGLKVGVIPELWAEVLKTASRSDAIELATAYLRALARRQATRQLANPHLEDRMRRWLARRMINHQRRLDGVTPLPDVSRDERLPIVAAAPAALPQGPAGEPPALPVADLSDQAE